MGTLFSGYFFPPEHLGLPGIPIPQEWSFVMSKLPIATIGCGEGPDDQTKLKVCDSSLPWGGVCNTEHRTPKNLNMAKLTKKSWKPKTTNIRRWKKKKTHSHPGSRHNRKVS